MPVTRYYVADDVADSASNRLTKFNSPTARQSAVWPDGTDGELQVWSANRRHGQLGTAKPATTRQWGITGATSTLAQTARQSTFCGFLTSKLLAAQTIPSGNWVTNVFPVESNNAVNGYYGLSIYVWRPSTSSVVGYIYDNTAELGAEFPTASATRHATISGSSVTTQAGDRLVFELWFTAAQAMATAYTFQNYARAVAANADSTVDGESLGNWIDAPDALSFLTPSLTADTGTFTLTGQDATLTKGGTAGAITITADSGSFTEDGKAANLLFGALALAAAGSFALTGNAAETLVGYRVTADSGVFNESGQAASLLAGRVVPSDVGTFALTGNAANTLAGLRTTADPATFVVTGQAATTTATRRVASDVGAFALTGQDATLAKGLQVAVGTGAFTLTGQDIGTVYGRAVVADRGPFTLTGVAADLRRTSTANYETGTFTLTGQAASLAVGRKVLADTTSYALTGQAAVLIPGKGIISVSGSFALAGQAASLVYARDFLADTGAYTLTGQVVDLEYGRILAVQRGLYALTGDSALLRRGRILSEFVCPVIAIDPVAGGASLTQAAPSTPGITVASLGQVITLQQSITDPVSPTVSVDQSLEANLTIRSQC